LLSVIIASYNARDVIDSCLKSLEAQRGDGPFEVIVVDSSTDGASQIIREKFPWVDLYVFPQRMYCGEARNFGISVARGDIVAFIDADCTADSRWVSEILKAHESPRLAIGGSIGNGNPESYVGWGAYFSEFSQWMPARASRTLEDVAGANMSYKKEAFGRFGSFIEGTYCSDTEFHWRLKDAGHHVLFLPSLRVYHKNIPSLGRFLIHEFHHGLSFARVRVRSRNFSFLRRASYASLSPLIAAWLLSKIAWRNVKNPVYLKDFLKTLPVVALGAASWSLGELVGYIRGGD
jgi:glycosyltransferase involved in cell wall biosynthesis